MLSEVCSANTVKRFEVRYNINTCEAGVMNCLSAVQAGCTRDSKPSAERGTATASGIDDGIELSVMTSHLCHRATDDQLYISLTEVTTAEMTTTSRRSIVSIADDDPRVGLEYHSANLATWTG